MSIHGELIPHYGFLLSLTVYNNHYSCSTLYYKSSSVHFFDKSLFLTLLLFRSATRTAQQHELVLVLVQRNKK